MRRKKKANWGGDYLLDAVRAHWESVLTAYRQCAERKPIVLFDIQEQRIYVYPYEGFKSELSPKSQASLTEQYEQAPLAEQAGYVTPLRGELPTPEAPSACPPLNLATLWLGGALLFLTPLLAGLVRTLLMRRQAGPIDDSRWTALFDDLRRRLALSRRVALYETEAPLMPMTWGLFRPVVMLPRHAHEWTDQLRRIVLLHELAHVKRCDVGYQLLGRVACAVYWFHPLAWYALRRLRIERELACDDCVVLAGERASDYAAELLQIARSYRAVPFAAVVAMAQRSNLEHRLSAMFDRACSHLPVSGKVAKLLLAGVLSIVTAVAAIRLARRADADEQKEATSEKSPSADDDLVTVSGNVVDPQGKPLTGAKVSALHSWRRHITYPPLAKTKCDSAGHFTVSFRKSNYAAGLGPAGTWKEAMIVASTEGLGLAWIRWRDIPVGQELTLKLVDDMPILGRVVDLEGPDETRTVVIRQKERQLAKAVKVRLADHPTGAMTAALAPSAKIVGRVVDRNGAPVPGATLELLWFGSEAGSNGNLGFTATDERGRFEYTDVPTGCIYNVQTQVNGDNRIYINDIQRLAPGETKDLGDIKVSGQAKPNAKEAELPVVGSPQA